MSQLQYQISELTRAVRGLQQQLNFVRASQVRIEKHLGTLPVSSTDETPTTEPSEETQSH